MFQLHTQDIVTDLLKVGTMLVVSRVLTGGSLQDQQWQMASLYTLAGFTAYHLTTRNLLDTGRLGAYKPIGDDWLKVGTMMVVSRLLAGGDLMDRNWQMASLFTLLGFTVYNLTLAKVVKGDDLTDCEALAVTVDDALKFGTMFVVSRLLAGDSLTDQAWIMASLATIAGFAVYNFGTKKVQDMLL